MEFFDYLIKRLSKDCEVPKAEPGYIKMDDGFITEVKYKGELYRIFIQKDNG